MGRAVRWGGLGRAVGGPLGGVCRGARVASLLHVEVNLVNGGALVAHADVVLAGGVRRHRKVSSGVLVLEEHLPRRRTDLCVALVISTRRRPVAGEQTSDRDRLRDAALVRGLELEGHTVARAGVERKGEGKHVSPRAPRHGAGRQTRGGNVCLGRSVVSGGEVTSEVRSTVCDRGAHGACLGGRHCGGPGTFRPWRGGVRLLSARSRQPAGCCRHWCRWCSCSGYLAQKRRSASWQTRGAVVRPGSLQPEPGYHGRRRRRRWRPQQLGRACC